MLVLCSMEYRALSRYVCMRVKFLTTTTYKDGFDLATCSMYEYESNAHLYVTFTRILRDPSPFPGLTNE